MTTTPSRPTKKPPKRRGWTTETTAGAEEVTGPAPGVTDDTIKIGVTYVDTASLKAVGLNFDLGDYVATYQALVDDINAGGGINGRQLEVGRSRRSTRPGPHRPTPPASNSPRTTTSSSSPGSS